MPNVTIEVRKRYTRSEQHVAILGGELVRVEGAFERGQAAQQTSEIEFWFHARGRR
jgi:hypothetical protein